MGVVRDEVNVVLLSSTSSATELPTQRSCFSSTGADGYTKLLKAVSLDHGVAEEISG